MTKMCSPLVIMSAGEKRKAGERDRVGGEQGRRRCTLNRGTREDLSDSETFEQRPEADSSWPCS